MSDTPTTQVAARLTDEQLAEVTELAATEPISAIVMVWQYICPDWADLSPGQVKAWDYSLPRSQWTAVATALTKYRPEALEGANVMMDWVNVGPSSREDES
jgi:hypothetical protein